MKTVAVRQMVSRRHVRSCDGLIGVRSKGVRVWEGVKWMVCHSDRKHFDQRLLPEIHHYHYYHYQKIG